MPVGGSNAKVTVAGARSEYLRKLEAADVWATRIATMATTDRKTEEFPVLGRGPILQKWTDERVPQEVFETSVKITPDHYEASFAVHRDTKADDQVGGYDNLVGDMAIEVAEFPNVLIGADVLDAAYSDGDFGLSFDGQFHFDTDHVWPGPATFTTAQDNDLTGAAATGTTPTVAEFHTALDAILEQFITFKDDKGRPFHRGASNPRRASIMLLCPPDMVGPAEQAIESRIRDDGNAVGIDNNNGTTRWEIISNQYTANNDRIQAFIGNGAFMHLARQDAIFSQVTADSSGEQSYEAWARLFDYFGVDLRVGAGLRMWADSVSHVFT